MRAAFGLLSLLVALVIVGVLAKKQLAATGSGQGPAVAATAPPGTRPLEPSGNHTPVQGRQLQQQIRQSLDATLQAPRPMPQDAP